MLDPEGEVACGTGGTDLERMVITQPLTMYVDVIQVCRLNTDHPVFPEFAITEEGVTVTAPDSHVPVDDNEERSSDETIKRKRRGQKKADYETVQKEAKVAAAWKRASETGTYKADFAKDKGMTLKALDQLLDRVRKRKSRSDK